MAKGQGAWFPRTMSILNVGPDGKAGTADDRSSMLPGESGQADFTIEGMKEGTHKIDFAITATLEGLPIGPLILKGKASGAVLVRNPDFALTLGHPATVRAGEEYNLFITISNTGNRPANLVTVALDPRALSGAAFVTGEANSKSLETLQPGSAAVVKFRLKSQRTGSVTATAFESPDLRGHFILRAGVGDNNIPLSPDSLILPYTGNLPADLVASAVGLLGQAWSIATAPIGALPASVLPISRQTVTSRAYDLSEAGLRVLIGDNQVKAVVDLTFDLFGSDVYNRGLDSLRRSSTIGLELNRALGDIFKTGIDSNGVIAFQASLADKASYRPAHLSIVSSNAPLHLRLTDAAGNRSGALTSNENNRVIPYADSIVIGENDSRRQNLILVTRLDSSAYSLELAADDTGAFDLGIVLPDSSGVLTQYTFSGVTLTAGATGSITIKPGSATMLLSLDDNGDGVADRTLMPSSIISIPDNAPHIVAATQLTPGFGPGGDKHGRNVAVLFSERVNKDTAQNPANYGVDENLVKQATLQPGSRMAFLLLRDGIGPFFKRNLTAQGLLDQSGKGMTHTETLPIRITASGPAAVVTGTVRTARGEPVSSATIRLYQKIWYTEPLTGIPEERYALFTEKQGNADGTYGLEYVYQNDDPAGPFQIDAINPLTNEAGSLTTGVVFDGQRLQLDIFAKAKGNLSGVVQNEAGIPVGGASVQVTTLADNGGQTMTTDASGTFSFRNLLVGAYSLKAVSQANLSEGSTMGTLPEDGTAMIQDVTIRRVADKMVGLVVGKVFGADGSTLRSGVIVIIEGPNYKNWQRTTADGSFSFSGVYAGTITVTARDDITGEQSESGGVMSAPGQIITLNVIMRGTGSVSGLVKRDDGKSAEGLYVVANPCQGQPRIVLTDANGAFSIDNLPIGNVNINIIDPRDFNRTVASGAVTILAAGDTARIALFVPLKALATGTIQGTVYHRDGTLWANAQIRRVVDAYHYFVHQADITGKFSITNVTLAGYTLSVVVGNELINASTDLWYDTQVRTLELRPVGSGTVTGTTWDDAGKTRPTGADVTLYSMKPNLVGVLTYDTDNPAVVKSDPQTGRFTFNGVLQGSFTVASSNIFRPVTVSVGGRIESNGQVVNVDLPLKGAPAVAGEPVVNQPGSVSGAVQMPDGSAAGKDVRVTLTFGGADVTVTTDEQGLFHFAPIIPSGSQPVIAEDPATSLKWKGNVYVPSGLDVPVIIKLLGRGMVTAKILNASGTPIQDADIVVQGTSYPNDAASGVSDSNGQAVFTNLAEGNYAVSASGRGNISGLSGRNQAFIPVDKASVTVEVRLAASATVTGRFLKADGVTPISGGQITLKRNGQVIAYSSSSSASADAGRYRLEFIPLGDFTVEGYDSTTERRGTGGGRLNSDSEVVDADVIVTPRGSVKGTVLNYGGTIPVVGAPVSISVSGVDGFNFSSVTAPDGGFFFSGVPAGRYTVDATDPSNGLRGQANGALSYENETTISQVRIAATGSTGGRVLMPDGISTVSTATVRLNGGSPRQVDSVTPNFRYDNLAAGFSYTLTASQPNTHRTGSSVVTISRDLEIVNGDIILGGVGTVSGLVLDADQSTPLSGAKVELHFSAGTLTDYTAADGSFSFSDISTGSFTLTASHTQRTTGDIQSGYLQNEGQVVVLNLALGPVASVKATVLLADGVTPSRGGGIRISTNTGRTLTGITDSYGQYTFSNIPIPCTISLYVEDAAGVGIGRAIGILDLNGQLLDLGTIVLDDKPIFVTSINPVSGSVNVPVNQTMRILFSEPADPTTVNSDSIYLTQGGARIDGMLQLDTGNSAATFTPVSALKSFTLYSLVATDAITDRVGRKLALSQSISFTTVDNVPPLITSVAPADGSFQVASDAVVRLTFSEVLDATTLVGVTLSTGGVPVAARTDLIQNATVVVLTPLEPLACNRNYTVRASGVRDLSGNILSGTVQATFATIDTIAPTVVFVAPADNSAVNTGAPVVITVQGTDDLNLKELVLTAFGELVTNQTKSAAGKSDLVSFALLAPTSFISNGAITISVVAKDSAGNVSQPVQRTLQLHDSIAPDISLTSPGRTVKYKPGETGTVTVAASDNIGVSSISCRTANSAGAAQLFDVIPVIKSATRTFSFAVPTDASPSVAVTVTCTAGDAAGNKTSDTLLLTVADIVPPVVTGASIVNNATGVSSTMPITVTYNEAMQATSFTSDTVQLRSISTGVLISGTRLLSADGKTLIFTPATVLNYSTVYQFTIHGACDVAGNIGSDYNINFSTRLLTDLMIENIGSQATPYVLASGQYGAVTMINSFVVLDGPLVADSISFATNSIITHKTSGLTGSERLDIVVTGALSIDATSRIDVSARGYLGAWQGGNGSIGRTNGNTTTGGSASGSGGSYGGYGGYYNGAVNAVYGDPLNPNEVGSGGTTENGNGSYVSGNGGGLVSIKAGTLMLEGNILADGGNGNCVGGGGSGGGIRIDTATLSGSGHIYARGGWADNGRGGGGGGRIAIYYGIMTLPQGNVVSSGAGTGHNGGAGTVYLKSKILATDHLLVDNRGIDAGEGSSLLRSMGSGVVSNLTADTLTATGVNWQPGALKGMKFAPDVNRTQYFTVVDNDATSLHIDPAEGDLTKATSHGLTFSGVYAFSKISILGKGCLTSFDRFAVADELLINDSTLVTNTITADKLTMLGGALLSQWRTTTDQEFKLELTVGTLNIDPTTRIDVSARGYLGAWQSDNGSIGRTFGNTATGGSSSGSGGSYGGYGGYYNGAVNVVYGDPANPNEVGSGGTTENGNGSYVSGNGGGLVRIKAGTLILEGNILADGGNGNCVGGGGSGGGIRIDAATLSGSGHIYARGGWADNGRGGGSGGRIAIYYATMNLPQGNIIASGAATGHNGGAGTIYLKNDNSANADVIIAAAGSRDKVTILPAGNYGTVWVNGSTLISDGLMNASKVVLNNSIIQTAALIVDTMSLATNSILTHPSATIDSQSSLDLTVASSLSIDTTSSIDVSARGYLGAWQSGNGSIGRTNGNTTTGGSASGSGGSYGGYGGYYNGAANAAYGDPLNPNEVGSGGTTENGNGSYVSGNGGGLVRIKAGTLILEGNILADGGNGNCVGGGGSGGGIRIDAGTLSGSGYIYARGGWADNGRGGGGGGRIAIYYGIMTIPQGNVVASGAGTGHNGGAGTVYLKLTILATDHLLVDNRGIDAGEGSSLLRSMGSGVVSNLTADTLTATGVNWQPGALKGMKFAPDVNRTQYFTVVDNDATSLHIDPVEGDLTKVTSRGLTFSGVYAFSKISILGKGRLTSLDRFAVADELLINGSTLVTNTITADKLTMLNGALLSQWRTTADQEFKLELTVGTLNIDPTTRIDVSARGYLGAWQSDNGSIGRTFGNTATGGSASGSGGSYGGYGGYYNGAVNVVYGDPANPNEVGSGGTTENGNGSYVSGNGGGLVRIKAGTLILEGNILADGGNGNCVGGGGSGGGIRIDASTLSGSGYIYARGGWADNGRGGGGGGRIAIYYGSLNLPPGNLVVSGAATSHPGGAGTVHLSLLP